MADAPIVDADMMRQVAKRQTFTNWTGLEVISGKRGRVELRLPFRPEDMGQHHGFLHGAMTGLLVDAACAYAAATEVGDVVTGQYSINYLAPGIGEAFTAIGEVVKAGKRQVVADAKIFAENKGERKLIARGSAILFPVGEAALAAHTSNPR